MLITPGSKLHPQSNRLALTWPSSRSPNRSTHQPGQNTGGGDNKLVPIAEQGKVHTSFLVSPSGQPVLKVQSAYQGYFTPGNYHSSTPTGHPLFGGSRQGTPSNSPYRRRSDLHSERTGSFISFDESPRPVLQRTATWPAVPGKEVVEVSPVSPSQRVDNSSGGSQVRNRRGRLSMNQSVRDLSVSSHDSCVYGDDSGSSFQPSYDFTPNSERKKLHLRYNKRYEAVDKHPIRNGICQMCCWFLMTVVVLVILFISLSFIIEENRNTPILLIPSEKMKLETYLHQNLFGQPIAVKEISSHIDRFLLSSNNETSLVMSFHGGVGVGKSFSSRLLSDYFFSSDQKSSCVSTFCVPLHHSWSSKDSRSSLQDWLEPREADCDFRILIIDSLGGDTPCSLVSLLQDSIRSLVEGNLNKKHIVVMTTDIAALRIHDVSLKYQEGNKKDVLAIEHFSYPIKHSWEAIDEFLQQNSEEKCHFSGFINILNLTVPFLPLERRHIKHCAERDATNKGMILSDGQLNWVADQVSYFPRSWPVFSESGCKLVSQKVDLLNAVGEI